MNSQLVYEFVAGCLVAAELFYLLSIAVDPRNLWDTGGTI